MAYIELLNPPGSLFLLSDAPTLNASKPDLPILANVDGRFNLPHLDEYASGSERMLAGVDGGSSFKALFDIYIGDSADSTIPLIDPTSQDEEAKEALEVEADLWSQAGAEAGANWPRNFQDLKTWDSAQSDPLANIPPTEFLSEARNLLFEAAIAASEPVIKLPKLEPVTPPAFDIRELLHLMIRSTLGTTSTQSLKWNARGSRFTWAISGGRGLGFDSIASNSAIGPFLQIATGLRRLEIIVDSESIALSTPTHHALLHAVSNYLTFIKDRLRLAIEESEAEVNARWIKWSLMLKDLGTLLHALCLVMGWPLSDVKPTPLPSRPPYLLTHIYGHLLSHLGSSSPSRPASSTSLALAYLMSTASQPFLDLLHQWLGLKESDLDIDVDPDAQPWKDLGITRVQVAQKPTTTERQLTWQYEFSSKRMPTFIPKETRRILFEAGRSLRLLRDASEGQHPLCASSWELISGWGWGQVSKGPDVRGHTRRVTREIDQWRRSVKDRARPLSGSASSFVLRQPRKARKPIPMEFTLPALKDPKSVHDLGTTVSSMLDIASMFGCANDIHGIQSSLWTAPDQTTLRAFIVFHSDPCHPLLPHSTPTLPLYISSHLLGPLVIHSELVSTSLVSLYLDDLKLLDHLDVLRAFWLGGDPGFFERVAGALFGKEEAGSGQGRGLGRRARTRVRMGLGSSDLAENAGMASHEGEEGISGKGDDDAWGMGLGVGLSERDRWPPGGGELAYALRTTLIDDKDQSKEKDLGSVWGEIEDRVSFAIKDLPDDDSDGRRARWLNPQAIEALDFLYLAYSPPPTISVLLPQALMEKYQTIQNYLLRLARVQKVLDTVFIDLVHLTSSLEGVPSDVFSKLENKGQRLRFKMSNFVSGLGRHVSDTAIGSNWDRMRRRLERLRSQSTSTASRPSTPFNDRDESHLDLLEDNSDSASGGRNIDEEEEETNSTSINQLKSIQSLVTYHQLTLDRILRSCLLSPQAGYQVTFKVLMSLLGSVLDFGKIIKLVIRKSVSSEDALERIKGVAADWDDKQRIFMHALERLSLRTSSKSRTDIDIDLSATLKRGTEHDLHILLDGEGIDDDDDGRVASAREGGGGDLAELLMRLDLGHGDVRRQGRYVST